MHQAIKTILPMLAFAWAGAVDAATYYVRNGGNDSADGRSHATAWASLGKVNNFSFAAGDKVLFHEGHRWVGQLTIDWAGTASDKAVVGAYYLDGTTPVRGFRTSRPIIDGEDRLPSNSRYAPLVLIRTANVRVENLRVQNSEGRGIGGGEVGGIEVVGNSISNVYTSGLNLIRTQGALVENNYVTSAGLGKIDSGVPWGAAIDIAASVSAVVRNNTVSEVWGEGINAHSGSRYTLIENNRVFGVHAVGIYSDGAPDTTIRRNLVLGTSKSFWWRSASAVGAGIALNNENYHYPVGGGSQSPDIQSRRTRIYNNLVAYTTSGLAFWGQLSTTSFDDTLVYNNTFVDNNVQVSTSGKPIPNSKFINNILLSLSSGTRDVEGTKLFGMVARNNYFSQGDPGGDYAHSGNRFSGLKIAKMSGWRALTSVDQVSWRDFVVTSGSSVIGAGDDEPRRASDNAHNYVLDFNKAEHGDPMDMGGLTFSTPTGRRPMPPTGLMGT